MPVSTQGLRKVCLALVILGLLAGGVAVALRIRAERSSRAVDLVVDYNEVVALAGKEGISTAEALTDLKANGVTSVALAEETLKGLSENGTVRLTTPAGMPLSSKSGIAPGWNRSDEVTTVVVPTYEMSAQLLHGLQRVYPAENIYTPLPGMIAIRGSRLLIGDLGLGLSPEKVAGITGAGLRVVPRLRGNVGLTRKNLVNIFTGIAALLPPSPPGRPRGIVVFDGDTVPGYQQLLPDVATILTENDLVYGSVEFAKQKGDVQLGAKLNGSLVRVHSISLQELSNMNPQAAVQRFALAVKDRNIRVLYVHLPMFASNDPLADASSFTRGIAQELRSQGFVVDSRKMAHPFTASVTTTAPLEVPAPLLAVIFVGAGAALLFWVLTVLPTTMPRAFVTGMIAVLVIGLLAALGSAFVKPGIGRMLFGLLAAMAFPLISLTWAYRYLDRLQAMGRSMRVLLAAVYGLAVTTLITMGGAIFVAGMMAQSRYLVKVGQFAGVKAALALPLLIFGALIITEGVARAGEQWPEYRARCSERLRGFLAQPIYLWGIVAAMIGLVAMALLLARSGNDSGVGASTTELHIRSMLEQLLVARPRTKEFILGHPLFIFSMVAAAGGKRALALLLLLGASIGQVDVLNTYCHAHTPVLLSLLRTFNGLWLGIIIGIGLLLVFMPRALKAEKSEVAVVE
ncbi:MAG: DUF5693 family protein [Armatimonadota bacterium]